MELYGMFLKKALVLGDELSNTLISNLFKFGNIIYDDLENGIYVGDTKANLEASLTAEIPSIHANYGFGHDLNTRYIINDIKELPNIIQNI